MRIAGTRLYRFFPRKQAYTLAASGRAAPRGTLSADAAGNHSMLGDPAHPPPLGRRPLQSLRGPDRRAPPRPPGRAARYRGTCLALALALAPGAHLAAAEAERAVTVEPLHALAVRLEDSAPAEVESLARTRVAARLSTEVNALHVAPGDRVAAGDRLAELDCTDFEDSRAEANARLQEIRARLELAGIRLERTRDLRAREAVSRDRLDEVKAERDALAASLSAQRERVEATGRSVERCRVAAPFDALVVSRPASPGAFVQPGSPLVELIALDRLELRARLSERQVASVTDTSDLWFMAGGSRYPVEPIATVGAADPASRTRTARLRFTDSPPAPGTAGRLHWIAHQRTVPADLAVRRDGALGIFLLEDGRAHFHELEGAVEGRPAPTTLEPDQRIIVEGRFGLTDGMRVRVVE